MKKPQTAGKMARALSLSVLIIPVQESRTWQIDRYSNIPPNEVTFAAQGLNIHVKSSSNPLTYPILPAKKITGFRIKGIFRGLPRIADLEKQGLKGFDDFPLRVGFIIAGDKKLSGMKSLFAPAWVKNLYAKIPEGQGLDHVRFYNVTQNPSQKGTQRVHPGSDLIQEEFFETVTAPGAFDYDYNFKQPLTSLATWISVDGDDTKSEYEVLISSFELKTQ